MRNPTGYSYAAIGMLKDNLGGVKAGVKVR